jgi:hypothetical protein
MAQFPGEFFMDHEQSVQYVLSRPRKKFEDLTAKEKLEFCMWIHQNFDELIAYARSQQ